VGTCIIQTVSIELAEDFQSFFTQTKAMKNLHELSRPSWFNPLEDEHVPEYFLRASDIGIVAKKPERLLASGVKDVKI
jgi:hypothetical protein